MMTNRSLTQSATQKHPSILATDLDGTLIPLEGNQENVHDLKQLQQLIHQRNILLCFVTGRHIESVQGKIHEHALPEPDWIICDVGTSIRRKHPGTEARPAPADYLLMEEYQEHLQNIVESLPIAELKHLLSDLKQLRLQEDEKQGEFKLSYYVDQESLNEVVTAINARLTEHSAPYSLINSIDPFNGDGLIDLLPKQVSKAYALKWWSEFLNHPHESIVFAGDSGNDHAALVSGYFTILVGNASDELTEQVTREHLNHGWKDRLYKAQAFATSGVLEGCKHFGLAPENL